MESGKCLGLQRATPRTSFVTVSVSEDKCGELESCYCHICPEHNRLPLKHGAGAKRFCFLCRDLVQRERSVKLVL